MAEQSAPSQSPVNLRIAYKFDRERERNSFAQMTAVYEAERLVQEAQSKSKVSISFRSKDIQTFQLPLSIVTSFQDFLNKLDVEHHLRRAENCRIEFPNAGILRGLYRKDELFEFLQTKKLVILQESDVSVRLDYRTTWAKRLNHDWHLVLDQRALDAIRFLMTERLDRLQECTSKLRRAIINPERGRIHSESVPEIGDACRLLNNMLMEEDIPLEAIGVSGDILFEYHVWTDLEKGKKNAPEQHLHEVNSALF